ncbi:MAG: DinB family protein [Dehalococcoidia bacterium]
MQQMLTDIYGRISQVLDKALEGLTPEDVNHQPKPDCNSMGWLTWHITRGQDRVMADLMGVEQLWVKDGWHAKFNRPADLEETGLRHSVEDLAAFRSPGVDTLLGYHHAMLERLNRYIGGVSEAELNRQMDHPRYRTVGARLAGNIGDNLQHAGQVAYLRGQLKGIGWLGA